MLLYSAQVFFSKIAEHTWTHHDVLAASSFAVVIILANTALLGTGASEVVIAGGMESMSNCPFYLPGSARGTGLRMGDATLVDGLIHDGLWDPYGAMHMGEVAEDCARDRGISRSDQDAHALASVERAQAAATSGATANVSCSTRRIRGIRACRLQPDGPGLNCGNIGTCGDLSHGGRADDNIRFE